MRAADPLEEMVAASIPHEATCWIYADDTDWRCVCGASARRAKLLLHVSRHVGRLTRGKVYLDGPAPAPHPTT